MGMISSVIKNAISYAGYNMASDEPFIEQQNLNDTTSEKKFDKTIYGLNNIGKTCYMKAGYNMASDYPFIEPRNLNDTEKEKKFDKTIFGLSNIGNTCYMNAAINAIIRHPILWFDIFLVEEIESKIVNRPDLSFLKIYISLIKFTYGNTVSEQKIKLTLRKLKSELSIELNKRDNYNQEDSMEFYREFIRLILHEYHELNKISFKKEEFCMKFTNPDCMQEKPYFKYQLQVHAKKQSNVMLNFYTGTFLKETYCENCKKSSNSFEEFLDISIPTITIQDREVLFVGEILEKFFSPVYFDTNRPMCKQCKKESVLSLKTSIIRYPQIFTIYIDRVNYTNMRKDKRILKFDSSINVIDLSKFSKDKVYYSLYSAITHQGSATSGHYTASCLTSHLNQWTCFNDTATYSVDNKKAVENASCLMFYQLERRKINSCKRRNVYG